MIYLIDDNQDDQRRFIYNIKFVDDDTFEDLLISREKIENSKIEDTSNLEFLKDAKCILLHDTTEDYDSEKKEYLKSKTNVTKIIEKISDYGEKIPLVRFSNRFTNEKADFPNKNYIRKITKDKFYQRLYDFITEYKNTGKIEIRIIAEGKNFISNEMKEYRNKLLNPIALNKESELMKITETHIKDKKAFEKFFSIAFSELKIQSVYDDLEDNPITICEFRNKINKIIKSINNYGKNIYNW